jgi:hypothetical protein
MGTPVAILRNMAYFKRPEYAGEGERNPSPHRMRPPLPPVLKPWLIALRINGTLSSSLLAPSLFETALNWLDLAYDFYRIWEIMLTLQLPAKLRRMFPLSRP